VIVQTDFHNQLQLPTGAPIGKHDFWGKVSNLQWAYDLVLKRVKFLVD
jgi:hypothetical protein